MRFKLDFNLKRWLLGFSLGTLEASSPSLCSLHKIRLHFICLYAGPFCLRLTKPSTIEVET